MSNAENVSASDTIKSHMPSFLCPTRYGSAPPLHSAPVNSSTLASALTLFSPPQEKEHQQKNPKTAHEMPVDRHRAGRDTLVCPRLIFQTLAPRSEQQVVEAEDAAEQVRAVQSGQSIKERTV